MSWRGTFRKIRQTSTFWFAVLIPIVLLPLPLIHPSDVSRCAYCVILIAIYWITEIIPLAVTSLLPVLLFPLWGVMSAKDVCSSYVKDTLMLFLGSLIVAVAVERWNLHKRLALRTLTLVGTEPKWLLLGIMLPCWFLSMWMSNTATAAMMMPIVIAILQQIKECRQKISVVKDKDNIKMNDLNMVSGGNDIEVNDYNNAHETDDEEFLVLAKSFSICTAYAANIGGMATLTGTPPNVIFKGQVDSLFESYGIDNGINFANWLLLGFPISVVIFIFCWGWLTLSMKGKSCCPCIKDKSDLSYAAVKDIIKKEYESMGNVTFAEIIVAVNFVILVLLWVTRSPGFVTGWGSFFKTGYVKDSTSAILIAVLMFILPSKPPSCFSKSSDNYVIEKNRCEEKTNKRKYVYKPILNWNIVHERVSWGVLLLMGGGFALADGCMKSGLSKWISDNLIGLSVLPSWIIVLLLSVIIALATEVTSNAATTTLFVPIAGNLAIELGHNPLYFMIPCTIATSLAFLLPVATPPNAIAFSSGYLQVKDMVQTGVFMNIFSLLVVNVAVNTWGVPLYKLDTVPGEFLNITTSLPLTTTTTILNISTQPFLYQP